MSLTFPKIRRETAAQIYIGAVIVSGFAILLLLCAFEGPRIFGNFELSAAIFAIAVIVGEVLPVKLGRGEA